MPDITNMQQMQTPSNFRFSAMGVDQLGASEYTLATIVVDVSGSVSGLERELERCLHTIVTSCKKSPRSDNLMIRVVQFNHNITEVHGFRELNSIQPSEYANRLSPSGNTSLYDAVQEAAEATITYARLLNSQEFMSNAVIFIVTDGMDNQSNHTPNSIRGVVDSVRRDEVLESMAVILIGVGQHNAGAYLANFRQEANITQFIDLEELFRKTSPEGALAKLAGYVSKSISSTSQALASGNSQPAASTLTI